ncbi:MAG: ABC transporter permease [Firmicutes bacterium]|nr:ABC transporter permease [Bacillota bacterium]
MRKYIFIFKSELMSNLQYVFNTFTGFIGYFIHIFIFLNVWQYIYSDKSQIINGYTMNQMIWYVIVTEILWSVANGRKLCRKISEDVRSGNIAYNINKPYNYIGYSLANHLGSVAIKALIYTVLGILVGLMFLGTIPSITIIEAVIIIITGILATVISTLLITFIGLFSFYVEDSNPFFWVYSKFILVLGTLFPIEYFPKVMQPFLNYSPIYAVSYGPAKLFTSFTWDLFIKLFIAQVIYIIIGYGLCSMLYKKGVKRLNVNGG